MKKATSYGVPRSDSDIPDGFRRLAVDGLFIRTNGPLYFAAHGEVFRLGLRVEERHVNTMGNLHGGMMATFFDMLFPLSAQRKNKTVREHFLPTVSLEVDYTAPARLGTWIEGSSELLRVTGSLVFIRGVVTADGGPCASGRAILKIGEKFTRPHVPRRPAANPTIHVAV